MFSLFNKSSFIFSLCSIFDKPVPFSSSRLYISTEIDNPHFPPPVYNFVTMINFTLTFQSLQDQLLSTILTREVPYLENQHLQLLASISLDAMTLEELEERTLNVLQNAQGQYRSLVTLGNLCIPLGRTEQRFQEPYSELVLKISDSLLHQITD